MAMDAEELVESFELFDDWEDRYRYIIDLGKKLPPMPEAAKTEENKVRGCMSQVWMIHDVKDGKLHFEADSDAFIVRGLIALLMELFNDRTPEEILSVDALDLFRRIGLEGHLSPNRRNGLVSMVERIKAAATASAA